MPSNLYLLSSMLHCFSTEIFFNLSNHRPMLSRFNIIIKQRLTCLCQCSTLSQIEHILQCL